MFAVARNSGAAQDNLSFQSCINPSYRELLAELREMRMGLSICPIFHRQCWLGQVLTLNLQWVWGPAPVRRSQKTPRQHGSLKALCILAYISGCSSFSATQSSILNLQWLQRVCRSRDLVRQMLFSSWKRKKQLTQQNLSASHWAALMKHEIFRCTFVLRIKSLLLI